MRKRHKFHSIIIGGSQLYGGVRHLTTYVILVLFFLLVVPLISIRLFPHLIENAPEKHTDIQIPDTVSVYITADEKTKTIPFEDYIVGVVASEMPDSFEMEALKAQAVASRTYALGRVLSGTQLSIARFIGIMIFLQR